MAKVTITIPDAELPFFKTAADRAGEQLAPFLARTAKVGALWEDAHRPRRHDPAADLARAEEQAVLDAAADAAEHGHHGHAA